MQGDDKQKEGTQSPIGATSDGVAHHLTTSNFRSSDRVAIAYESAKERNASIALINTSEFQNMPDYAEGKNTTHSQFVYLGSFKKSHLPSEQKLESLISDPFPVGKIFYPEHRVKNYRYDYKDNMAFMAGVIDAGRTVVLVTDIKLDHYSNNKSPGANELLWLKENDYSFEPAPDNPIYTLIKPPANFNLTRKITNYGKLLQKPHSRDKKRIVKDPEVQIYLDHQVASIQKEVLAKRAKLPFEARESIMPELYAAPKPAPKKSAVKTSSPVRLELSWASAASKTSPAKSAPSAFRGDTPQLQSQGPVKNSVVKGPVKLPSALASKKGSKPKK